MTFRDRLMGVLPWLLAAIIVAGIVHIVSVLAMPRLAKEDAFARIARIAPLHTLTVLPQETITEGVLPFEDPATVLAVCRFDLRDGPVRLRGRLNGDGLLLLSFRHRFGTSFYAMNDRGASRGELDVVIVTRSQLEELQANDPEDELPLELRLQAPSLEGFVLLRTLAATPSQRDAAIAGLKRISCRSIASTGSASPIAGGNRR